MAARSDWSELVRITSEGFSSHLSCQQSAHRVGSSGPYVAWGELVEEIHFMIVITVNFHPMAPACPTAAARPPRLTARRRSTRRGGAAAPSRGGLRRRAWRATAAVVSAAAWRRCPSGAGWGCHAPASQHSCPPPAPQLASAQRGVGPATPRSRRHRAPAPVRGGWGEGFGLSARGGKVKVGGRVAAEVGSACRAPRRRRRASRAGRRACT